MKYRWLPAPPQPLLTSPLAAQLKISPLLAQCLVNRGFSEPATIETFLRPRLKQLADPFLLPDMDKAVARLLGARERGESLVIFGDYDVDGVTSSTLLLQALRALGWQASSYLPHRMEEGYGLSRDGVENCLKKYPTSLLLAVDCGSTAVETIAWLRERGVDVIVLDHHQISNPAPAAVALVNPHNKARGEVLWAIVDVSPIAPDPLPSASFVELCSVGLAFKLAHALVKQGREINLPGAAEFDLRPLLDLVALGTIADLVPLTGENRIFVSAGLERLNSTTRPGLMALKQIAQSPETLGTFDVGFQLAPRLNASGRLETAEESLHLLMAASFDEAMPLAQRLDSQNRERQKIERTIAEEATGHVRSCFDPEKDFVIVEGRLHWHIGVVGIVSSRVLQEFYRPTFIIGGEGDNWRGSGRSIAGFDLAAALRECDDLLVRHGGHAMAAGVTLHPDKLDAFRARLNDIARRTLKREDLQPPLRLDAEVKLSEISLDSLAELDQLKPMGQGNPALQFYATGLSHQRPLLRMGAEKQHVKLWVTDGKTSHECVWWNAGKGSLPVGKFDLAFAPQINDYNGKRTVQLKVLDWRPAE
ncbi:MAG: single-stranded-DNA-specific exonuclease RecJ [Verrucomicrobiota bacterium]